MASLKPARSGVGGTLASAVVQGSGPGRAGVQLEAAAETALAVVAGHDRVHLAVEHMEEARRARQHRVKLLHRLKRQVALVAQELELVAQRVRGEGVAPRLSLVRLVLGDLLVPE